MKTSCETMRPPTLAESVEERIISYIHKAKLDSGDTLPKEEDFVEKLNVSRNIVREALFGLKALGLIESKRKRGMVLRHPNAFAGVKKLAKGHLFSREECFRFMQIRAIMELGMANLIWENKTDEGLRELESLAGNTEQPATIEEEIAFHKKLFSMGGNFVADQFLEIISTAFEPYVSASMEEWKKSPLHTDICNALANGTREEFTRILELHLKVYLCSSADLDFLKDE